MRVMSFVQEFVTLSTESKVIMFKKESNHINHTTQCRLHLLTCKNENSEGYVEVIE